MKILMISPTYAPRKGGLETYIRALAHGIVRDGHEVAILTNRDTIAQPVRQWINGVLVLRTGALITHADGPSYVPWEHAYFALLEDVRELIAPLRCDIVHTHTQVALLLAHMSGLAARAPLVASFHETDPFSDFLGAERTRFVLASCPVQAYVVGSETFARQVMEFGVPADRVKLVYMGVEQRRSRDRWVVRKSLHDSLGLPRDKCMILLIGRLTPRKGQLRAVAAFEQMELRDRSMLVLVGSDNGTKVAYREAIREAVRSAGDSVLMFENASDELRDLLIDGSDIGTQPSVAEGLGLSAIELVMAEVPMVASDVPGLREVLGEASEWLVDTDNPDAYAKSLDQLSESAALREKVGTAMALRARSLFAIDFAVASTLEVYREVCRR